MNHSLRAQIKEWDWHYRVGFDDQLFKQVDEAFVAAKGFKESTEERRELSAYRELVSVDCMVGKVIDEPGRVEEFLEAIRGKSLLYLPPECAEKICSRLTENFVGDQKSLLGIQEVVERAAGVEFANYSKDLLELALGHGFLSVANVYLHDMTAENFADTTHSRLEEKELGASLVEEYKEDAITYGNQLLCVESIQRPQWRTTTGCDISCFAEYWPSLITGKDNELVLGKILESAEREDVIGSIIHEIAGHACFYNLASSGYFSFLDHGAICLIEGWATWCEWSSPLASDKYKSRLRHNALNGLRLAEMSTSRQAIDEISGMGMLGGNRQLIEQAVLNFHQYPCYSLSYYAGAVYFEIEFEKQSSSEYWEARKGKALTNILNSG